MVRQCMGMGGGGWRYGKGGQPSVCWRLMEGRGGVWGRWREGWR